MIISTISIVLAITSAVIIAIDLIHNPQSMKIMNAVWILTALWASILGLMIYFWFGREKGMTMQMPMNMPMRHKWQSVILSTLHCGAGCSLADIIGSLFLTIISIGIVQGWIFTYALALIIGVWFQYSAIKEMSNLPISAIIKKAIKADFFSLTAWQIGMYLWMYLLIFEFRWLDVHSDLNWEFWFAMQQAMLIGFVLALPINYLLIRVGIKNGM